MDAKATSWTQSFRKQKQKYAAFLSMHAPLLLVLFIFLGFALVTSRHLSIWWDEAVYLGMGKYLFSLGQQGLWEPFRPLVLPLLLGMGWKSGLHPFVFGKVLILLFSLGCLVMVYLLGTALYSRTAGVLASSLLASSPLFFSASFRLLTDIPSAFFVLAAVYALVRQRYVLAGVLAGIASMTRFPAGLVLMGLLLAGLYGNRGIMKRVAMIAAGFFVPVLPYLISNIIWYGNPFLPLTWGSRLIATSHLWMYQGSVLFYVQVLFKDHLFSAFALVGIVFLLWKKRSTSSALAVLVPALFLMYFINLAHKEARFVLVFLGMVYILAACGMMVFVDVLIQKMKTGKRMQHSLAAVVGVLLLLALMYRAQGSLVDEQTQPEKMFAAYISEHGINGSVFATSPFLAAFVDNRIVYPTDLAFASSVYANASESTEPLFAKTCDFPCNDAACTKMRDAFMQELLGNTRVAYHAEEQGCAVYILEPK